MIFEKLPFARKRPDQTFDLWSPEKSGDYEADLRTGSEHFKTLLHLQPTPAQIDHVFFAIVEKGQLTGVEQGFIRAMVRNTSL